ncbi:MAG: cytochrome c3 family protein [Desulfovibrionaceae bacterium]
MHNRTLPVLVIAAVLLLVAVAGYLVPSGHAEAPVRLLFDSAGGKVLFAHQDHAKTYGVDCRRCHHAGFDETSPRPCGDCHPAGFEAPFATEHQTRFKPDQCGQCHHARLDGMTFDHAAHQAILDKDCQACHHGPDIEPEPMACNNCHGDKADGKAPALRDAAHQRCASCHEDETAPAAMKCGFCHKVEDTRRQVFRTPPPACGSCHTQPAVPLPNRSDAFHKQCMGCHEQTGKGPWGQDACNRCHFR